MGGNKLFISILVCVSNMTWLLTSQFCMTLLTRYIYTLKYGRAYLLKIPFCQTIKVMLTDPNNSDAIKSGSCSIFHAIFKYGK